MADMPSDIAASAAQAGYQAREAARTRDAHRVGQAHAARTQIRSVDESASTVDTSDADTQVFTDAEGTGGQGRQLGGEEKEDASDLHSDANPADDSGVGPAGLDIHA